MNDLIIVKQLPVIEEHLKKISEEIEIKVNNATNLICSEETVKEVKKVRAELNNEFKELEKQRKSVKEQVLAPYETFEQVYKEFISEKFKTADTELKNKIDNVETEIKEDCKNKMIEYFSEYCLSKNLDSSYLKFDELNINITLGLLTEKKELTKKAKEELTSKVDSVCTDIETIKTMQNNEDVLVEYLKHKDLSKAIKDVNDRYSKLEILKQKEEEKKQAELKEQEVISKVDECIQAPIVGDVQKEFTIEFLVTATKDKLSKLKKFLIEEGIRYESK